MAPPSTGSAPIFPGPNPGLDSNIRPRRSRCQGQQPAQDGSHPPDRAPPGARLGSRQASRPLAEGAGPEKMTANVAEGSVVPHRPRGHPPHPNGSKLARMPDRRPRRRMLVTPGRTLTVEPGRIDLARRRAEKRKRPAPWALPKRSSSSAPRPPRAGGGGDSPFRPGQKRRDRPGTAPANAAGAPFQPRAPRGEREPGDPNRAQAAQGRPQDRARDRAPGPPSATRSPAPYRSNPARGGEQGRSGSPLRSGRSGGPRPARFSASRPGSPRSDNRSPRSDNPRSGNAGRPFQRPSRPGARPTGPRPPATGGAGQGVRPKSNPRGPGNERPRSAGYARPGGKPGPGGSGKGRDDRGPRPPYVPGSRPAKSWPRAGGSSAKPGKPPGSFRGRKPDRKKPGA